MKQKRTILFILLLLSTKTIYPSEMETKTPVITAIIKDKPYDYIEQLLKSDSDANEQDANQNTPLIWSIFKKKTDITELLIERKANVNAVNKAGHSAHCFAVNNQAVKEILRNNNARDPHAFALLASIMYQGLHMFITVSQHVNNKTEEERVPCTREALRLLDQLNATEGDEPSIEQFFHLADALNFDLAAHLDNPINPGLGKCSLLK